MRLFEWQSEMLPVSVDRAEFIRYLDTVWKNRPTKKIESESLGDEFTEPAQNSQRFFSFTHDGRVAARNFVGVVQHEGLRISVFPKIFRDNAPHDYTRYTSNLLWWLSWCKKFQFPFSESSQSPLPFEDFLEVLIWHFAQHTEAILSAQPFQAYQKVEEETSYLRGNLLFDEYTRRNLITGRWHQLYCAHTPFQYDNDFNRIVKCVTRRLLGLTRERINLSLLEGIRFLLDDVSDVHCRAEDCDRIQLNPLYTDLHRVLDMCRMFLTETVLDSSGDDAENFCFLVPMEFVFEDFLVGFLQEHFPRGLQKQSTDYLARRNGQKVFQIRNDIYYKDRLIIDTKYKIRYDDEDQKGGVSQADLYQMLAYTFRRGVEEALLLYPEAIGADNSPTSFVIERENDYSDVPRDSSKTTTVSVRSLRIDFDDLKGAREDLQNRIINLHPIFLEVNSKKL